MLHATCYMLYLVLSKWNPAWEDLGARTPINVSRILHILHIVVSDKKFSSMFPLNKYLVMELLLGNDKYLIYLISFSFLTLVGYS